jgi:hypothetical protein
MPGTGVTYFPTDVHFARIEIGLDGSLENSTFFLYTLDNSLVSNASINFSYWELLNLQAPAQTVFEGTNTPIKNLFLYFPNLVYLYVDLPSKDYSLYSSSDAQYFLIANYIFMDSLRFADSFNLGLARPSTSTPSSALPSLNGNGSEFIDGTKVTVKNRVLVYTVSRSFMTIYADNSYTATYDLVADNGAKLTCPEELLTQYIAPITTP